MNTPLRGGKGQTWEGGIRVPMFVKWSGRLKPGTYSQPVIQMDLTATMLALAGVQPDAKWPLDGVNLMPFLEGDKGEPHAMLCWDYENQWAIRKGPWKLAYAGPDKGQQQPVIALYDLTRDISETTDLSAQHPERVATMKAELAAWKASVLRDLPGDDNGRGAPIDPAPASRKGKKKANTNQADG